jgi:hypothetical protein
VTELGPDDALGGTQVGATITFLDRLALSAEVTYGLDKPAVATVNCPSDNPEVNILHVETAPVQPFVGEGRRNLFGFRREGGLLGVDTPETRWKCRFSGRILQVTDEGLTEDATTSIVAYDPWQLLYKRPVELVTGQFPKQRGFSYNNTKASTIALELLDNTITNHGPIGIDAGLAWGGTVLHNGEIDQSDPQIDRFIVEMGMTIGEVWDQLVQTGNIDIVLTPVYDPILRPGILCDLTIKPIAGTGMPATFSWDSGDRNVTRVNRQIDGTVRTNKVQYYLNDGLPDPTPSTDATSVGLYGEYWTLQQFPVRSKQATTALGALQLALRKNGITTVVVEPTPTRMPLMFTEWWLGDVVTVEASSKIREALAGDARVYGVQITLDENSLEQVPQLLTAPS